MILASLREGRDGRLLVVSKDARRAVRSAATTLQSALDHWAEAEPVMRAEADALNSGAGNSMKLEADALDAILPRCFQFLDASAFLAHNHILADAWGFEKRGEREPPLMYQGLSHEFYPAHGKIPFTSEGDEIDFEAEYGVITDAVPAGVTPQAALAHIKLIIVINDWSLRAYGPKEMRGGFGFIHAKPPCALSAFAVTPDELGPAWKDGRVALPLRAYRNGELFGQPNGAEMHFSFGDLIAHAAATRDLCAGTVIGSGTVSSFNAATVGSGCIAERRALDRLAGRTATPYLSFGERVRLEMDTLPLSLEHEIVERAGRS